MTIGFTSQKMMYASTSVYLLRAALPRLSSITCWNLIHLLPNIFGVSEVMGELMRCEGCREFARCASSSLRRFVPRTCGAGLELGEDLLDCIEVRIVGPVVKAGG
jgi:hypothetical protein